MTVSEAYWAHVTGTAECTKACREAWQRLLSGATLPVTRDRGES